MNSTEITNQNFSLSLSFSVADGGSCQATSQTPKRTSKTKEFLSYAVHAKRHLFSFRKWKIKRDNQIKINWDGIFILCFLFSLRFVSFRSLTRYDCPRLDCFATKITTINQSLFNFRYWFSVHCCLGIWCLCRSLHTRIRFICFTRFNDLLISYSI